MIKLNVFCNKPYPKVNIEYPSQKYAELLSHVYASNESELTATHLYVYQSIVLERKYPEIARTLLEISKVEMHHLKLLGETIQKLGELPIFADQSFHMETYWNGNDVYYDTDLKTILEIDIESERRAIHDYQMLINVIDDVYIKELLERIILDEQIHIEIFLEFFKRI